MQEDRRTILGPQHYPGTATAAYILYSFLGRDFEAVKQLADLPEASTYPVVST